MMLAKPLQPNQTITRNLSQSNFNPTCCESGFGNPSIPLPSSGGLSLRIHTFINTFIHTYIMYIHVLEYIHALLIKLSQPNEFEYFSYYYHYYITSTYHMHSYIHTYIHTFIRALKYYHLKYIHTNTIGKCRQLPCRTFISTGSCPYGDRCVFLHDPSVVSKPIYIKSKVRSY